MNTEESPKNLLKYAAGIAVILGFGTAIHSINSSFSEALYSFEKGFDETYRQETGLLREDVYALKQEVRKMTTALQSMQEVLQRVETLHAPPPPSAELLEDSDSSLYLDSVPCCGGEDNVTNFESIQTLPEDVGSFQEVFERLRANLPEDQRLRLEEMDRENEEYFNTLDEAGLAELEKRKQEFKDKMRSQFTTMMAAMPKQIKQNWEKNMHLMEESWEHAARTTALMRMQTEYRKQATQEQSPENTASPQTSEEEWKMQEALRMLEEAAREQQ